MPGGALGEGQPPGTRLKGQAHNRALILPYFTHSLKRITRAKSRQPMGTGAIGFLNRGISITHTRS